jgi:carboxyl-terminal processing protease
LRRRIGLLLIVAAFVLGLGMGTAGGALLPTLLRPAAPPSATSGPNVQLLNEAWDRIQQVYVDRSALQSQALTYGAIGGMVNALGDTGHSIFLTPEMLKQQQEYTAGQFEGIGVEVQAKDGHLLIAALLDGSPAQKAGLQPGEIILQVDGKSVDGLSLSAVSGLIRGPAGTSVTLTVLNPATDSTRQVTVARAKIVVHNVTWSPIPGTKYAHLRIAGFSQGISQELKAALKEIQGQSLQGIVLDLRSNPGGLLDEAVSTASQFLRDGNVLLAKDAAGNTRPVPVQRGGLATETPLVVLVDGGTASASEIVAGALQDAGRAPIVGHTTFGTGTVLQDFALSDGSVLSLAVEEWLTPKERVIWHQGLAPDQEVALPAGSAPLYPEEEKGQSAAQLQATQDKQLLRAIELLNQH